MLGAAGGLAGAAGAVAVGFVVAYVLCYATHEWGHLIGARLTGARMPLNRYSSPLIGLFNPACHTRRQFLALSWGGVAGYTLVACASVGVWASADLGLAGVGLAVGGLAFLTQSLAVDLPQIWKVSAGADATETNRDGTAPALILRRTWQCWTLLAIALLVANGLF